LKKWTQNGAILNPLTF